jgi:hypothetical protein
MSKILVLLLAVGSCGSPLAASAQGINCEQIASMVRMTSARSSEALIAEKQKAGNSYRAQVVFASRAAELHPKDQSSTGRLLNLIPQDDAQKAAWMTFGDRLCDSESIDEMKALGRLGENLPRNLAKAVLLVPDKMQMYVSYAKVSIQDPHSDYAVQMRGVCEARHPAFLKALNQLPAGDKDWFRKHILNPAGCLVIALPEAQ